MVFASTKFWCGEGAVKVSADTFLLARAQHQNFPLGYKNRQKSHTRRIAKSGCLKHFDRDDLSGKLLMSIYIVSPIIVRAT